MVGHRGLVVLALVARAYSLVTSNPIAHVPVWGWPYPLVCRAALTRIEALAAA